MPKIVNTALKAKAKAKTIKFDLEAPRGQGLASRTTSLVQRTSSSLHFSEISEVTLWGNQPWYFDDFYSHNSVRM